MTYDATTGTFYLSSCDISTSQLFTVDVTNATVALVGAITNAPCAIALAADAGGNLFTYDIVGDVGLSVNKATGAGTVLGSIGFDANFGQGMEMDPATGTIYLAAFNNGTFTPELRSFNTTNGSTTFLGTIGGGSLLQFGYAAIVQGDAPPPCDVRVALGADEVGAGGKLALDVALKHNRPSTVERSFYIAIKDNKGRTVLRRETAKMTINYLDEINIRRALRIPSSLKPGRYEVSAEVWDPTPWVLEESRDLLRQTHRWVITVPAR